MNKNWLANSTVFGLLLACGILLPVEAQTESTTSSTEYTFKCISRKAEVFETSTVRRDGTIANPSFIVWKSQEFSAKGYTPKRRCEAVTDKLNAALAEVGGNPDNLRLTMGLINNLPVLCYVNKNKFGCDNSNVLVTLSRNNRGNSSLIVAGMVKFLVTGTGSAIVD